MVPAVLRFESFSEWAEVPERLFTIVNISSIWSSGVIAVALYQAGKLPPLPVRCISGMWRLSHSTGD
jgi:hypothetical protein